MKRHILVILLFCAACSSDDNNNNSLNIDTGNNNSNNQNNESDAGNEEDIPTFGDVSANNVNNTNNDGCDEAAKIEAAWPLHDAISTGTATFTAAGQATVATIDASAGGLQGAANNPFLYIDLDGPGKVEVTDADAIRTDTEWEIALRRTSAFVNGGEAGPGNVTVARLTGTTFDAVGAGDIPADNAFAIEDPVDDDCNVVAPISGFGTVISVFEQLNPDTTSGSWYNYSMGAMPVVAYADHVYIIRDTDQGKRYKFAFETWDSGTYTVRWEEIP